MAQGDVKSMVLYIAADSYGYVQPPAGEHWMITDIGLWGDGTNAGSAALFDGTYRANFLFSYVPEDAFGTWHYQKGRPCKVFINNSVYLEIFNHSPGAEYHSISAIQVK